jgi:TolB-like protein/predicted Zn-dependent protease
LPFVNVNANADTEYLSDGITDSLINSLSQAPKLKVIARSSVFSYKGKETDPQAVGRDLKVQAVVTGRITQRGYNLSISVELMDARDKSHIWGEQYNRKISDLLAVQEEISSEISNKLRLKLTGEEQQRVTKRYTDNVEAYQLYLKGRHFADQFTEDSFKKAVDHFTQAIEKDPNYALAYAGLAEAYWIASAESLPPREAMPKAREAAVQALKIDEHLAEAHTSLAVVLALYDYDLSGGEREFKRAIDLNPNSASAHQWYGYYLASLARADEAFKEIKHAQELDPLSLLINTELGMPFYFMRQYDRAIEQFKRALEMDPNMRFARLWLAWTYVQKGMYEEAIAMLSKPESDHPFVLAVLGQNYALSGKRSEAQKIIDRLNEQSKHRYVSPYGVAKLYLGLGNKEQALRWLEKTYENREDGFIWINTDPAWDSLRSEPRFQDLARRVGPAQ